MEIIDIILLIIIGVFAVRGYTDGLILSVLHIIMLILALFLTVLYVDELVMFLQPYLPLLGNDFIRVIAFILLFFILLGILNFIANMFRAVNKLPLVGMLNQWLGAVTGALKGVIILSLVLVLVKTYLGEKYLDMIEKKGPVYHNLEMVAPAIYDGLVSLIPIGESFYDEFKSVIDDTDAKEFAPPPTDGDESI